ncbi:hypothetical protein J4772_12135 [Cohnella sp. LGH]|uniref:hypothetical protein n=1 Tax=unclassified Cohnella TaxID=2636738 RepID=UPI001ADA1B63|nr:hypothetical protein [Cohnella sp. LGH]QTH45084.1 hypothetical protein J4772_12135 [Cohnella sp. LGH]
MILLDKILKGLAIATFLTAVIAGFIQANQTDSYVSEFRWGIAVAWWISGAVSGIVFFAIGLILEYQSEILHRLRNLEHEANKNAGPAPRLGNSKASLDKLSGFKL